ncbi:MAG: DUF4405 domain-containing protein [Phycisphaerales bacterium]|nr:DUF4405 domain-containing protein [Phycisphaerales bacterium]
MNDQQESPLYSGPERAAWTTRGFISLLLMIQTVVLAVSGVICYVCPRGREAHWVDWRMLALDKDQWESIHVLSAPIFVILGVVHLAYNWRLLLGYIRRKTAQVAGYGRELAVAALLTAGLVGVTVADLPPVNLLNEQFKEYYAASVESAPWPHAEEADLDTVSRRIGIPVGRIMSALEGAGMPASDSTQTLAQIARAHGTAPNLVFAAIRRHTGQDGEAAATETSPAEQECGRKRGGTSD